MTVFAFEECCCNCLPGDLPALITSPGALNQITRANWIRSSQCCWSSTFNFNNAWTSVVSPVCWSRSESYNQTGTYWATRHVDNGTAPQLGPGTDFCTSLTTSEGALYAIVSSSYNFFRNEQSKVYLIARLASIENRVLQTQISCGGSSGLRYIWSSQANYEFRYIQKSTIQSGGGTTATLNDPEPCFNNICSVGSAETTDAQHVATLIAGTPEAGLGGGTFGFQSSRVLENLNLSGPQSFAPNVLSCASTLSPCIFLSSVLYDSLRIDSETRGPSGPTAPFLGVMEPPTSLPVRTLNLWWDPRNGGQRVFNYHQSSRTRSFPYAGGSCLEIINPQGIEAGQAGNGPGIYGTDSICAKIMRPCRTGVQESNLQRLRLNSLCHISQDSASGTFSEVPYTPQSASISIPAWEVVF
jgi:hypothetical protein